MRITGRRKTTSHAWKKQGPGKNSACPLISSRSPHTRSDQSEPTFAGIRPTDVPPFRAAQIVGARPTSRYLSHVPIWITSDLPTSMISPCQEGKSSPDALRRSACIKVLGTSARVRASRRWFLLDPEPDIHLLSQPRRACTED